jgi:hypothetical protein
MTISRQKLYSLGEPFGDSATERKVDGGYICGGGGGKGSSPPPPAPAPKPESAEAQAEVESSRNRERRRQAMAMGQQSTMLTGGQGVTTAAPTAGKSLLGQ